MPVIPPPPPGPIEDKPGHFAWSDWLEDGLVEISTTPIIANGSQAIVPVANTPTSVAITFPVGRFTSPPAVVTTADTQSAGVTFRGCSASGVTAAGCLLWLTRTNTQNTVIRWLAVEMVA